MSTVSFSEYALSPELTPDATYTVELLIEKARAEFDPIFWDEWTERKNARESRRYKPRFSKDHVPLAEKKLKTLSWLSLQRIRGEERPIHDLNALRFLPKLTGLSLGNNQIRDISPLAKCTKLKRLYLELNPITDISALANCKEIEILDLRSTSVENLQVLERLPKLRDLSISAAQIPALRQLARLPALVELGFELHAFDSFEGFPEMPELRIIRDAHVKRLDGLARFSSLENLLNLSGAFDSLAPLSNLEALTHVDIFSCRVDSLKPLSKLNALRVLRVTTKARNLDLAPLETLPVLHQLDVECHGKEPAALESFKAELESWDTEFRAVKPRYTPSLELEIVDQGTFDRYVSEMPYNKPLSETNEGLLASESEWLGKQINGVLSVNFVAEDDYTIPSNWHGARSRTVMLISEQAISAFPRLVLAIQGVLSNAKNDWIIYFQSEGDEFIVWIYPDKIVTTKKYAKIVRSLIRPD